jgi:hypothetical protein
VTTTALDDASGTLPPPTTMPEVVAALRKLSASEGITWQKVQDKEEATHLRQLRISQDEFNRTSNLGVNLAVATVAALTCVVEGYRNGDHPYREWSNNVNWIILNHELNLSGNLGFNLTRRRTDARMWMNSMSPELYERTSKSALGLFALKIIELRRSLCWHPGELEAVETTRILGLRDEREKYEAINYLFMNGKDAYLDKYVTASALSGALPALVESLQGAGFDLSHEPQMLAAIVQSVGWNLYDTFAQVYLKTVLSREEGGLILPWQHLKRLVAFETRLTDQDYSAIAQSCDDMLLSKDGGWPFWVSDIYLRPLQKTGHLFVFDSRFHHPSAKFWEALDRSLLILAQLLVRVDRAHGWGAPRHVDKGSFKGDLDIDALLRFSYFDVELGRIGIESVETLDKSYESPIADSTEPPEVEP